MRANSLRIVAALLILIGIGVGLFGYLQATAPEPVKVTGTNDEPEEPELERVVVAAEELPAGREIKEGDLAVASRYRKDLDGLDDRYARPADLFGRKTVVEVPEGEVVTADLLESPADGTPIGRSVSPGHKAIALAVDEVEAAGGYLMPGDVVDLVWFVDHRDTPGPYSRTLVREVRILAFGERIDPGPDEPEVTSGENTSEGAEEDSEEKTRLGDRFASADDAEDGKGEERQPRARSVVLEVADDHVSEVVLAARTGKIRLAVAGLERSDDDSVMSVLAARDDDEAGPAEDESASGDEKEKTDDEESADEESADEGAEDESDGRRLEDLVDVEKKDTPESRPSERQAPPPARVRVFSGSEESSVEVSQ